MFKSFILSLSLGLISVANAGINKSFTDNSNIEVDLSKSNYNRLVVVGDTIDKGYFPDRTLAFKTVKDGSAYIDILKDEPVTLFIDTKGGHHFSVTVNPVDKLGQTVVLTPENALKGQALKFEKKSPYEETITKLIHSAMLGEVPSGYGVKTAFKGFKPFNKNLSLKTKKQLVGSQFTVDIVQIYNNSKESRPLYESWFRSQGVKAVAFSQSKLPAKKSALMYVVRENQHG